MTTTRELKLDDVLVIGPGQPDNARLATLVRKWRKDSGLTQEQVARLTGVTSGYIRMIEKGDRSPSAEALVDLLRVFAVRHLTDYKIGDRAWDMIIAPIDDERRQTKYGVEFKGRMRSNRRAATEVERILRADGSKRLGEIEQHPLRKRGEAQIELLLRSFGVGGPLGDDVRQHLAERVAAERSQLRSAIHYVDADTPADTTISPAEADADLATLTRFLAGADPQTVRRLIQMIDEELGIGLR